MARESAVLSIAEAAAPVDGDQLTLSQQVYQDLETQLLSGRLLPDTQLSLRTLAISHNTSMQPIRDAVSRLVGLSALELAPGRSIRVPVLSRRDADEIWSMRLLLEGAAAESFAARNRPEEARRLRDHTKTLRRHGFGRDIEPTMRALIKWNRDLLLGSGSALLIEFVSRLFLRYAPFLARALSNEAPHDENFLQFTLHIQDELILAIEKGDAVGARNLRCADLLSFKRYLYSRNGW
jgi:DNA-binding GntR family transcriptional regulator